MSNAGPTHILEITIISAQDLHPASRRLRPYATACLHPDHHKLRTRMDPSGHTNPTWNDKFLFQINSSFLLSDTSAVTVDIRAAFRLRPDPLIGTVRILLSALHPSPATRFVALQVRRPSSLRPQGILNVGVALLDARIVRSMPLSSDPAFVLNDLIGGGGNKIGDRNPHRLASGSEDWQLERCGSVELGSWVVEMEREALESKLEKWRTELFPDCDRQSESGRSRSRSTGRLSCFCGGGGGGGRRD